MIFDPQIHNRQSIRLQGYDYASPGHYFVTVCVKGGEYWFGEIYNGQMIKSPIGEMAEKCWFEIPKHFPHVILDEFVVMPNHVHGIIEIPYCVRPSVNNGIESVGVQNFEPLRIHVPRFVTAEHRVNRYQHIIPQSIGSIVRGYKIGVTKLCKQNENQYFSWQRNFYDRIIDTDEQLEITRWYIKNNPKRWSRDRNKHK